MIFLYTIIHFFFTVFFFFIIEYSINITLTLSQKLVKKRIQDSSGFKCKASNMSCQHSIHCQMSQCIVPASYSPPLVRNSSLDSTNIERYMLLKLSKLQWVLLLPLDLNVSQLEEKKIWLNQDFQFINPSLPIIPWLNSEIWVWLTSYPCRPLPMQWRSPFLPQLTSEQPQDYLYHHHVQDFTSPYYTIKLQMVVIYYLAYVFISQL